MKNKGSIRFSALFLAAVICFVSIFPTVVFAEEKQPVIIIKTAEDFLTFAKNCTLDSWSRGKTFYLASDLDLSDTGFRPIPSFGGNFQGAGHKITGLSPDDGNSYQGLFRFIQEEGWVEGITVTGSVVASDAQEYIGGIAGSVKGTVKGCTYEGGLKGTLYVGGIAGIVEKGGTVEDCTVNGFVQGERYVGGIAGQNDGRIDHCENHARINPVTNDDTSLDTKVQSNASDGMLKKAEATISSAGDFSKVIQDTGGICGYSTGSITGCTNLGSVGYPHVGYNVGGIAGRSTGYISDSGNTGSVLGRKDVGGICGQFAPDIRLVFSRDTLDKLDHELTLLSDMADDALDHTDKNRTVVSDRLDQISEHAKNASDNTKDLADMTVDWADTNLDEINDLMDTVSDTLDRLEEISGGLTGTLGTMDEGMDHLEDSLDEAGNALGIGKQGVKELRGQIEELKAINKRRKEALAAAENQAAILINALRNGDLERAASASEALSSAINEFSDASEEYQNKLDQLSEAVSGLPDIGVNLRNGARDLDRAMDSMSQASEDMTNVAGQISNMFSDLSNRKETHFTTFGDDYRNKGDQIHDSVSAIGDQMDLLQSEVDSAGDTLSGDIRGMRDQLKAIRDILDDAASEAEEKDKGDIWNDVSEEEIQNTTAGKTETCVNSGAVESDLNAGGIIGSMAVESDLDPEEDIEKVGERSLKFHYETRAIVDHCINRGSVTAKRDGAGGTVGRMDLGYIRGCQNYGNVKSTDGNYVGGIAGVSASTIRGSYSKCMLSGKDYVGGIVGDGYDLYENVSFVTIQNAEMYSGAVAGRADKESTVSGNRFIENGAAGIDGVSYSGKAEPVSYEAIMEEENTPADFGRFTMTYVADDVVTARISCSYGDRFADLAAPEVPDKKGYHGVWETTDEDIITFDHIFHAVYRPYITTIESDVRRDDVHSVMLAEGMFDGNAKLILQKLAADDSTEQWKVTMSGTDAEKPEIRYRFIAPSDWKNCSLTIQSGENELPADWKRDKSACVFTSDLTEFVLVVRRENTAGHMILLSAVCATAAAVILIAVFLKNKKRKPKAESKEA